jgi:hypothetical protein
LQRNSPGDRNIGEAQEIIVRDRKRPIAKIIPFTIEEDDDDAAIVAAGLMRKGTGKLPASFWRTRRPAVPLEAVVAALSADRDGD